MISIPRLPDRPEWMDTAACARVDPELWYPEHRDAHASSVARRICLGCAHRVVCLDYALAANEKEGMLGREVPRAAPEASSSAEVGGGVMAEIQHGTTYGEAQKCRKRNGRACPPCRRQFADYLAQWRKERPLAARRAQRADKARERALWRLARMHPVLFRALTDEELSKDEAAA